MRTASRRTLHRLTGVLAVAAVAGAAACAHTVKPTSGYEPLPPFYSVAIVSEGPSQELKTRFGVAPDQSSRPVGTGVGMGAGTVAGIGAALTCGPFALLCATLTVPDRVS